MTTTKNMFTTDTTDTNKVTEYIFNSDKLSLTKKLPKRRVSKKDLENEPEEIIKAKDPFDIKYDVKEEREGELSRDKGEFTSLYGLEFYDKMDKAHYFNRGEFEELDECKSMIRMNYKFAMVWPSDIIRIIKLLQKEKKEFDLHEYPRYNCSIYFDLDDKKKYIYSSDDSIKQMYKDLVLLMTDVMDSLRSMNNSNKEFLNEFDESKLSIHCDSDKLNSMHVIYNDKVFYNSAHLKKFMSYVKHISEKNEKFKNINKIIDFGVYNINHSIRCLAAIKKDDFGDRKFIKYRYSKSKQNLVELSKKGKVVNKNDIITKSKAAIYNINIPFVKNSLSKKYYAPTEISEANNIVDILLEYAPETNLASEVNNLFCFNITSKDNSYKCPACDNEHTSNGWYAFIKQNKVYAGCHGSEYKNSPRPKWLFTLNMKQLNSEVKKMKNKRLEEIIIGMIDELDEVKDKSILRNKKLSFCDYMKFIRSKQPTQLVDVVEYLYETVVHVIDCGKNRLMTKSILNDGSTGINELRDVFSRKTEIDVQLPDGAIMTVDIGEIYNDIFYNYCSYDYIDFIPYLIDDDENRKTSRKFTNKYKVFNLFQGFRHKYVKLSKEELTKTEQKLKLLLDHVKILTNYSSEKTDENLKLYEYVIGWMAYIFQFPNKKNKVALAFYSKNEQAGKNIFWDFFSEKIIGKDLSRSVNSIDSLTQRFNKSSEGKLFTIGNEISSFAKHSSCEKLRSLITDILQEIESKGFDSYSIRDYNNFVFLTNNFNFMNIKTSDKRYLPMRMDESKIGDTKYFNKLAAFMEEEDTAKLFFDYLTNIDLSNFIVTKIPKSKMKQELTEDSLDAPLKFINYLTEFNKKGLYIELDDLDCNSKMIKDHKRILKDVLYRKYKKWNSDQGEYSCEGKTQFYRILSENGIESSKAKLKGIPGRRWHISIDYKFLKDIASKF